MSAAALDEFEQERMAAGPARGGAKDEESIAKQKAENRRARDRVSSLKTGRARKHKRRHRHCWWIPTQHTRVEFDNQQDQRSEIVRRQVPPQSADTLSSTKCSECSMGAGERVPSAHQRQ